MKERQRGQQANRKIQVIKERKECRQIDKEENRQLNRLADRNKYRQTG